MSSIPHAGSATTGYRASELQRYLAWAPALLGVLVALIGFILAGGGAYLAALGGSRYYVLVGVMLLAAGYLMIKRRIAGFYAYVGAFAFTSVWAFWEVGLSGWQLIPRLVGPFVLLVLAILVAPALDQTTGRRAHKLGLVGVGILRCRARHSHPDLQSASGAEPTTRCASKRFVRRSRVCVQEG